MWMVYVIAGTVGSWGFGYLFQVNKQYHFVTSLAGFISSFIYFGAMELGITTYMAIFLGTIGLTIYAEIMARVCKTTVTTFAICGLIPLVPGSGMYYMMLEIVNGNHARAGEIAQSTLAIAGLLALGIIFVSTILRLIKNSIVDKI